MQYIRQWKVGDQTFDNKRLAQRYDAERKLDAMLDGAPCASMLMDNADKVIALLKPFATPRTRKPRSNGTSKRPGKAAQAHATA